MKTSHLMGAMAAGLALTATAAAQNYSIDWFTVDGGGGTSIGGGYSVSGTIGQADANSQPLTGAGFSLVGGFWSLFSVQPPGGLLLTIQAVGSGQATLSWFPDAPGVVLQETLSLLPANWMPSPSGSINPIVVPLDVNMKFYRLSKP
jgi:hypothetical protein